MQRPELKADCNQQDFTFFTEEWRRFSEGSGSTDDKILRDELLTCAKPTLRKTLTNTLGKAKLSTISSKELMKEMERTVVEKCSKLMNLVQLMDMQQGRDKPFRSFEARCKVQANVCNLKTPCPGPACGQTVFHMD